VLLHVPGATFAIELFNTARGGTASAFSYVICARTCSGMWHVTDGTLGSLMQPVARGLIDLLWDDSHVKLFDGSRLRRVVEKLHALSGSWAYI